MLNLAMQARAVDGRSLKTRVVTAGVWSLAGYGVSQIVRFGSNMLMTRLLAPDMFGLMAIGMIVIVGLAMFSDLGLKQNVVQSSRGGNPTFLNTCWAIQIIRGVLLWTMALSVTLLLLLANHVGLTPLNTVYADERLPAVIATLSSTMVIAGFESTKLLEASRALSLGGLTKIDLAAQLAGILCMVSWACIDRTIWALVAGNFCSALVRLILSHAWLPGISNRWNWDRSALREIIQFSKWMFLSSILGFFANSGDRLLLGGMIGSTSLGIYTIAFLISGTAEQILSKIMGDVSFPALSEIARERPSALKSGYYRFHILIASFAYFCSGFLMMTGQPLVRLLYDSRYRDAGWMLEVLAAILMTVPFRLATQSFLALGMPRLLSNTVAVRLIALFVATPIGFYFVGLPGALWGIVLSHFLSLPLIILYQIRCGSFDLRKELLVLPFIAVGIGAGKLAELVIGR
jgi:O-antigen/teichoic acid export membrane protein